MSEFLMARVTFDHNLKVVVSYSALFRKKNSPSRLVGLLLILWRNRLLRHLCRMRIKQHLFLPALVLVLHTLIPMSRDLPRRPVRTLDSPRDRIVSTRKPSFGLELDITAKIRPWASHRRDITEFEEHLSKKDPPCKHVGHSDSVFPVLWSIQQPYSILSLENRRYRIPQELALRLEFSRDDNPIPRTDVEERRDGRMM
jgi:hypothetical protein